MNQIPHWVRGVMGLMVIQNSCVGKKQLNCFQRPANGFLIKESVKIVEKSFYLHSPVYYAKRVLKQALPYKLLALRGLCKIIRRTELVEGRFD